jgi:hypothetical protein
MNRRAISSYLTLAVLDATMLASCTAGPDALKAYDGDDLALVDAAILVFQPYGLDSTVDSVTSGGTTYYDSERDRDKTTGLTGWHKAELQLKPGPYWVHYRGNCRRQYEVNRTEKLELTAGHRYELKGKCPFSMLIEGSLLRMWIEDVNTGQILAGSPEVPARRLPGGDGP